MKVKLGQAWSDKFGHDSDTIRTSGQRPPGIMRNRTGQPPPLGVVRLSDLSGGLELSLKKCNWKNKSGG
jgi:hypothetical protein